MIHLVREKKGFAVKSVADNGGLLATSETLKTKQAAWKNVRAMAKEYRGGIIYVQDDTLVKPKLTLITIENVIFPKVQYVKPRYQPGINPKNKKP